MNWGTEILGCVERLQRVRNDESPESVYGIEDIDCMETDRDIVIDTVLDHGLITPPTQGAADIESALADALEAMLDEPCRYDHNEFCQEHYCSKPCKHEVARAALELRRKGEE